MSYEHDCDGDPPNLAFAEENARQEIALNVIVGIRAGGHWEDWHAIHGPVQRHVQAAVARSSEVGKAEQARFDADIMARVLQGLRHDPGAATFGEAALTTWSGIAPAPPRIVTRYYAGGGVASWAALGVMVISTIIAMSLAW